MLCMCNIKMYQYSNINETIKFLEKNEDNKKSWSLCILLGLKHPPVLTLNWILETT